MKNLLLILCLLASGCFYTGTKSGQQSASDRVAGEQSASVVRESLSTAPISVHAERDSVVSIDIPQAEVKATVNTKGQVTHESEEDSSWFSKKKLPLTLGLCFGGIGIILCVVGFRMARKASPTVDAAFGAADRSLAAGISTIESWIATSTDDKENSKLNHLKSQFEKHRGQLNSLPRK